MIVLNPFPSTGYSLYSMALGLENSLPLSELYIIKDKTDYAEVFLMTLNINLLSEPSLFPVYSPANKIPYTLS